MNRYFTPMIVMGVLMLADTVSAQKTNEAIRKGNEQYRQQQYKEAEATYTEVIAAEPANAVARYNRSVTLHRQGRSDSAARAFDDLAFKSEDKTIKAKAYNNKGAILSAQKKLEESIEEYKNALRLDPNDQQARENLQKALLELKKKNPQKKDKKKQEKKQQQQKPQPKMNRKEAEQRLQLLEQKEKEVQQRLQKQKSKSGGGQPKDW